MTDLSMVSLIGYDNTDNPERTLKVIQYCQRFFNFRFSTLVCRIRPKNGVRNEAIYLRPETGYRAAMEYELKIGDFVHTDYSLFVSHDGCILNPGKWNNEWLNYDFIGAPWPDEAVNDSRYRVGNTGFCLRSRKFMDLCSSVANTLPEGCPADVFACQTMRQSFETEHGVKFAPVEVAADFSWELDIKEYPYGRPDAFGGHRKDFMMTG